MACFLDHSNPDLPCSMCIDGSTTNFCTSAATLAPGTFIEARNPALTLDLGEGAVAEPCPPCPSRASLGEIYIPLPPDEWRVRVPS